MSIFSAFRHAHAYKRKFPRKRSNVIQFTFFPQFSTKEQQVRFILPSLKNLSNQINFSRNATTRKRYRIEVLSPSYKNKYNIIKKFSKHVPIFQRFITRSINYSRMNEIHGFDTTD